jgi:glycosyltransferase involved in cell wall biosynthesis
MRALVIAPQPFFSPRGTPLSVYYRTLIAAELGVRIDLLTYGEGADVEIPGVTIHRIPRFRLLGPVPVGPSLLKAWLDLFLIVWTVALLLRRRYDFVHAHEESVFLARYLKPLFRFKLVYDMHSSLPQQLRNFEFTRSKLLIGTFERLENSCLAHADAVITICPELGEYAQARMPDRSRHFLIENSLFDDVRAAGSRSDPADEDIESWPPRCQPTVVYAGTFEPYQGLDLLLTAFALVRKEGSTARLVMVGGTPRQVETHRVLARELGIESEVEFTGRVEQPAAKAHTRMAAVLVSPRRKGTNTPLKVYEQLASGIPMVATRIRSHTQVLEDDVCFLVDPDPESMAAGILAALNDSARRERIVKNARALYERHYSRRAYIEKLRLLLETLR